MNSSVTQHQESEKVLDASAKIVLDASDVFGMYLTNDAKSDLQMQQCNCCQTCQTGKC